MKRVIAVFVLFLTLSVFVFDASAKTRVYLRSAFTGGCSGCVDALDGTLPSPTKHSDPLNDGDKAIVITLENDSLNPKIVAHYVLDADSGLAETPESVGIVPTVISPDTNAGTKRWILTLVPVNSIGDTIVGDLEIQGDFNTTGSLSLGGVPLSRLASLYPPKIDPNTGEVYQVNVAPFPDYLADGSGTDFHDVVAASAYRVYLSMCTKTVVRDEGDINKICVWVEDQAAWSDTVNDYVDEINIGLWRRQWVFGAVGAWADLWDLVGFSEDIDDLIFNAATGDRQKVCLDLTNKIKDIEKTDFVALHVKDGGTNPGSATYLTQYAASTNGSIGQENILTASEQQNFDWTSGGDADSNIASACLQIELYMDAAQNNMHGPSYFTGFHSEVGGGNPEHEGYAVDYDIDDLHPTAAPDYVLSKKTGMTVQNMGQAGHSQAQLNNEFDTLITPLKPRVYITPYTTDVGVAGQGTDPNFIARIDKATAQNMTIIVMAPPPSLVAIHDDIFMAKWQSDWEITKTFLTENYTNVIIGDMQTYLGEVRTLTATGRASGTASWAATTSFEEFEPVLPIVENCSGDPYFQVQSCLGTCTSGGSEPSWFCGKGATTIDNLGANQIVWEHKGDISELLWDVRSDGTGHWDLLSDTASHYTALGNAIFAGQAITDAFIAGLNRDTEDEQKYVTSNLFEMELTTSILNIVDSDRVAVFDKLRQGLPGWFNLAGGYFRPKKSGRWLVSGGFLETGRTANDETSIFVRKGGDANEVPDCGTANQDFQVFGLANTSTAAVGGGLISDFGYLPVNGEIYLDGVDDWIIFCFVGLSVNTTDIFNGELKISYIGEL